MRVHDSALKHGIDPSHAVHAAERAVFIADLDEDNPARQLRLGFDASGRLLELVVLRFDSGEELLIHAMKARQQYLELLEQAEPAALSAADEGVPEPFLASARWRARASGR